MNEIINKLKTRWGVTSAWQVLIILSLFAITGFSTLYVHQFIDHLLGIDKDDSFWLKLLVFIFIVLPVYTALFYLWGIILGQKKFVTQFLTLKYNLLAKLFANKKRK